MENFGAPDFITTIKTIPGLDAEYAIDAIGGSVELYAKILKKTVRLLPSNIEQMDAHIAEYGDLGAFAVKAHGVKGSLNQIGALSLARLAESLENAAKEGDRQYCAAHYGAFKDEATRFHSLLSKAAPQDSKTGHSLRAATYIDRENLFDALLRAESAAEDFDALSAAEALSPFAELHFDANTDLLISRAAEALSVFKPGEALIAIKSLLKEYGKSETANREDEAL